MKTKFTTISGSIFEIDDEDFVSTLKRLGDKEVVWVSTREDGIVKLHITDEQLQGDIISKNDSEN